MKDSRREFHVGLMVIVAIAVIVMMVFRFGDIGQSLKPGMTISIVLPSASGVLPQTPVQFRGIAIGRVQIIELLPGGNGVHLSVRIDPGYLFPADSSATVTRSLLGDAVIDIEPGNDTASVQSGDQISGKSEPSTTAVIAGVEQRVAATLSSFERTGEEWSRLAGNLNRMLESAGPDGVNTLEQTSLALHQFTRTMSTAEETLTAASSLLNNPDYQQQLKRTMQALPQLLNETQSTLHSVQTVVKRMDSAVATVNRAAEPLARQSGQLVSDLATSMRNVQAMTADLATVSHSMTVENGSLRKLLTDPSMYQNLDRTASSLSLLLQNLEPVVSDLQIFSDKIARHPELLGIRGIVRGSDGVKNDSVRPTGFKRQ
ncbi:MAG: MlaD family protein [Fuerstiella sp.]|nr:MlaD family protein [Fuerstiella sp.]